MALTQEQKERMEANRLKAFQIRQKKAKEDQKRKELEATDSVATHAKRNKIQMDKQPLKHSNNEMKQEQEKGQTDKHYDENEDLEDFEQGASDLVSKREAKEIYCLPEGTLAVCSYVEKQNPFRKGFTAMKLYKRSEIRQLARKRFGGLDGLIEERKKRERKRYTKDLEETKNVFKGSKTYNNA